MKSKKINIIVSVCFAVLLAAVMIANIVLPDTIISVSERRRLKQFPSCSLDSLIDGEFFSELDDYALDQFVWRDGFRSVKSLLVYKVLRQKDNNGYYLIGDAIYKIEKSYSHSSVENAAGVYNSLADAFFADCNLYYTVVPDKNYFVAGEYGCTSIDYEDMLKTMSAAADGDIKYIDIMPLLSIGDYYRTDLHWDQSMIVDVADRISTAMGGGGVYASDFSESTLYPFKGSYYGPAAVTVKPDTLTYLTNAITDGATVFDYETGKTGGIYYTDKFGGTDSYDVFLSGARALIRIENPQNNSGRELFVVRDSFGSSLVPLLLRDYSAVTVIDLRYVKSSVLTSGIITVPEGSDVLFMYNTLILNQSGVITQ